MKFYLLLLILYTTHFCFAQEKYKNWSQKADQLYRDSNYTEAEENYRKANAAKGDFNSQYNIGNTLYQQGRFAEAKAAYEIASGFKDAIDNKKAMAYHNLGNSLMNNKDYDGARKNYIEALKLQPSDKQTKQNLAKAIQLKKMQQQQQEQQKQQEKQNDPQQNQDQQQQEKKNKENKSENNSNPNNQKENQQITNKEESFGSKKMNLKKEEAEQLLKMVDNKDKKAKAKLQMTNKKKKANEKDW